MTNDARSDNAFESRKSGTPARDRAEAKIEKLRLKGGFFVEAVRATRMAMALTDPNLPGNPIVFANQAFLDLSGYAMEEVLGQQPHFMNGADTDPVDAERFRRILEEDRDGVVETVQYAKDGRRFVATVLLSAFRSGDNGRTLHHFLSWADVTRRVDAENESAVLRETQAALRESEARYRAYVAASADIVYRMSPDWSEMRQLQGQSFLADTDAPSRSWMERYIDPSDHEAVRNAVDRAVRTRGLFELEHRVRRAGGGSGWMLSRAVPIFDDHGHVSEWIGAATDITDRRRAEEALRASEAKYRALFESIDEGFCIVEMVFDGDRPVDYRFVEVNPAFERHTGIAGAAGRLMRDIAPGHEQYWFDHFGDISRTGRPKRFEAPARELGDRWLDLHAFRVGDAEQRRVAMVFSDITQRKRDARVLRQSKAELEAELKRTKLLRDLATRSATEEGLAAVYEEILSTAVSIMESDAGTIQIYDPGNHSLVMLVAKGIARDMTECFHRVDASSSTACGIALKTGLRAFVDFDKQPWNDTCRMHVEAGLRSAQATPLLSRDGSPIGMLNTHWNASGHRPSEDQLRFLDLLARQAADLIEQGQAAVNLRESEERLRQFGEASQDVLWIRDAKALTWAYLTPAFETIYGLTREEALRGDNFRNWLGLVVPDDREHARAMIDRVLAGELVSFEYRIRRASDGAIRWLRDTDFPMRDEQGRIVRLGGIGQDITSIKLAEAQLRASEERLRSAAEVAKFALWDWNLQTGEVTWSDEHFRMEGYAVGEVTPSYEAWIARIHPDDRAVTEEALLRARDARAEYVHEFRTLHPNGSVHWLSARGRFFYDDAGAPVRMVGAMLETTEQREWEERQKVLIAELQHRTFNLMGMVSSMADATMRSSADLEEFGPKFQDRIAALARVQRLLSRLNEEDRVTFDQLIRSEFDALGALQADGRVDLDGPGGVALKSRTVQTLAMALHELTTNAVKYGALKEEGARLSVRWRVVADQGEAWLHVDWRESGVPMPPTGVTPRGTGQGRTLIEKALPYQLRAKTTYDMTADGVHCTIRLPVSIRPLSAVEQPAG